MHSEKYCLFKHFILLLVFLSGFHFMLPAQKSIKKDILPPELKCISVIDNNSTLLNWKLPENANSSYSYLIYYSYNPNGPYIKADSLPYNQSTYLHSGILPYAGQLFYYIKSCSLSVSKKNVYSLPSDTLKTIMLILTDYENGIINLGWNAQADKKIPGAADYYYIQREYPAGTWITRDSFSLQNQVLSLNDTIDICNAFLNYRISLPNNYGCVSLSTVQGKFLQDKTVPYQPVIDYVTVDTVLMRNVIKWQPDRAKDTKGYYIYKYINPTGLKIDSVFGRFNTTYIHWDSDPQFDYESYYIIAFDSCGLASAGSSVHNSVFLSVTPDRCNYNLKLSWNAYINMESGLLGYNIYKRINNGEFLLLETVNSSSTSYIDYQILADNHYAYYIKALDYSGTRNAISNIQSLTFTYPRKPDFNYLKKATVIGNNQIEVSFFIDTTAYITEYHFSRIDNKGNDTLLIQNLFYLNKTSISFIDNSVNTNEKSYTYILILRDICNNENFLNSNIGKSINLKAFMQSGMKNFLSWNKYEKWEADVSHYNIFRWTENGWSANPVATLFSDGSDTITYTDDVSLLGYTNGQFAYYVEAVEGNGNPYGFKDTSRSNIAYVNQYPKLFVPNAFAPDGYNSKFLPVMGFINPNAYSMKIYNRWGALVFETTDINQGWDGTYNNYDAPKGVYVYLIKIKNSSNETIEKHGTVTLIR